jgi:hypothetical protein
MLVDRGGISPSMQLECLAVCRVTVIMGLLMCMEFIMDICDLSCIEVSMDYCITQNIFAVNLKLI